MVLLVAAQAVCTEVITLQVGCRDLCGGVVAFEDELMLWQEGCVRQAGVDQANGQVVEAAVHSGERKELDGCHGREDLHEDLGLPC